MALSLPLRRPGTNEIVGADSEGSTAAGEGSTTAGCGIGAGICTGCGVGTGSSVGAACNVGNGGMDGPFNRSFASTRNWKVRWKVLDMIGHNTLG